MNEAGIRHFLRFYYESPCPERAPEILESVFATAGIRERLQANPAAWYFFARIAQQAPFLVRKYEALFHDAPASRPFLLRVLGQAGDERTRQLLEGCLRDERFALQWQEIQVLLRAWAPQPLDAVHRPVKTSQDLDFLWGEFLATGNKEPVRCIVDVLEWLDNIRERLAAWLDGGPRGRVLRFLLRPGRERVLRTLRDAADILCDEDQKEIVSAQDLDCYCSMDGPKRTPERFEKVAALLPFRLSEEELSHIVVKSVAKWSLASNAQQHRIVLDVCEAEAAKRINRSRIALLEITAYAYLAADDFAAALNRQMDSLTPDPTEHSRLAAAANADFERLLKLSTEHFTKGQTRDAPGRKAASQAVEAMKAARTYHSRVLASFDSTNVVWDLSYAKPDRFRVSQHAKREGEQVYDHWVTIGGAHFRSPDFACRRSEQLTTEERLLLEHGLRLNSFLLADKYLEIVENSDPATVETHQYDDWRCLFFTYKDVTSKPLSLWSPDGVHLPDRGLQIHLWVDSATAHLVKAHVTFQGPSDNDQKEQAEIIQVFASYNQPVSIVPPAFQLIKLEAGA